MKKIQKANLFIFIIVVLNILFRNISSSLNKYLKLNNYTFMFLVNLLMLGVPLLLYFIITKDSVVETLKLKKLKFKDLILVILIAFLIQPFMNFLSGITALILPNHVGDLMSEGIKVPMYVKIFVIGLMPAIFEECSLRGVTLYNYKHIGIKKSAIITGFLFAILHMNIQMFLYTFVMGIVFAYLVDITGSIYSSMITHFIINSTQLIIATYQLKNIKESTQKAVVNSLTKSNIIMFLIVGLIISVITFSLVILLIKKLEKNNGINLKQLDNNIKNENNINSKKSEKIVDIYFVLILLAYIYVNTNSLKILFHLVF